MDVTQQRRYRAGDKVDDLCRACKIVRVHSVFVAGEQGEPIRVVCDYCGSQHNYRGRTTMPAAGGEAASATVRSPFAVVSERERSRPPMGLEGAGAEGRDLEMLLRRIIREEAGVTPVVPADKWRGGELLLKPGRDELQPKSIPIETFFNKIVMIRNRLRVLEQQINATELPLETKVKLQSYVTGCYGSLTSFNVLFAEEDDRFHGTGGRGD
ncbi:MAG TPA: hypothetical protein VD788_03170 [Candidatus Polarisedimenticolaceae bacterium]|nr:hypothetical protein [Candidatus Polarisedimenticolaceae bacterium]